MLPLSEAAAPPRTPDVARTMASTAARFLASLDAPRRQAALYLFDDQERFRWNHRPDALVWRDHTVWHEGLRLANMADAQQQAAFELLETGLSARGAGRVRAIMQLERHLREAERYTPFHPHVIRDPESYAFAVFGTPGGGRPWAWRVGGHHLGVHFTIDGDVVAPTPLFFGASPAEVRHGPAVGLRTLPEEEDRARDLVRSLDPARRARAIVSATAPGDILTDVYRHARAAHIPIGLPFGAMTTDARERLLALVRLYIERTVPEIAAAALRRIVASGVERLSFAWAGGTEPGQGHYYAVQGPTFLVEYDKTQDGANHVHSVWRDVAGDWGEDVLARHYREAHEGEASSRTRSSTAAM